MRLLLLAACVVFAACAPAAAADDEGEFSSDALVSGHGGIDGPVKVEATRLVIRRAGNEALLDSVGKVLVGGPQGSGGNDYGFLRRVVSTAPLGADQIAIDTTEATLGDAVTTGSIHASHELEPSALRLLPLANGTSAPSASKGLDISLGPTSITDFHATFHDPTGLLPVNDFDVSRTVELTRAEIHFEPSIDLSIAMRNGKVDRFDATATGTLDASFSLTIDQKASIALDKNAAYRDALKANFRTPPLTFTLFETAPYVLPPQWIGYVPVVETVRFRVVLECDVDLTAELHADLGGSARSTSSFGVSYRNGGFQALAPPSFQGSSTFAMTKRGSVAGMCGVRSELGFYFYDLAGPTLTVTPYLTFDVHGRDQGFDFLATPGLRGGFGGRAQVLGWDIARSDIALFDLRGTPMKGSFGL